MRNKAAVLLVAEVILAAREGVTYSERDQASCPACGHQLFTTRTMPWSGSTRVRHHKCINQDCTLALLDQTVKSTQEL